MFEGVNACEARDVKYPKKEELFLLAERTSFLEGEQGHVFE